MPKLKSLNKDLSEIPKTVTNWLGNNFDIINQIYKDKERLIHFLSSIKIECNVSSSWFDNFTNKLNSIDDDAKRLHYLYMIYLKGCKLGIGKDDFFIKIK